MKSSKLLVGLCLVAAILVTGCDSWQQLQVNPNEPTKAHPSALLTGLLLDLHAGPWGYTMRHNQFHALTEPYYGDQDYDWGATDFNYNALRNVVKMEEEALRILGDSTLNPYFVLGKFLRAYFYVDMTRRVGDIPLNEAMEGLEGVYQPEYAPQKEVYVQALQWLEEANSQLNRIFREKPSVSVEGDTFFHGDLRQWQKVVNSFRLRVLISLSHHANDPDLRVKEQFAKIVNNPAEYPIISSNSDNLQIEWLNSTGNRYPIYNQGVSPDNWQFRNPISSTYLSILKETRDPRIFIVAEPTDSAKASGDPDYASKFTSFRGADSGALQSTLSNLSASGKLSAGNADYFWSPTGEPTILLGWPEVEFAIAEAINRGWIAGDAEAHYEQGIRASMQHYGVAPEKVDAFLTHPEVQYAGNNEEGLRQVLLQKYVAFFQNSGWEAFYNQRRTGVPEFAIGPANDNGGRIPKRWKYPFDEYQTNTENVTQAVERQYGGSDDINVVMWLIKD